MTEKERIAAEAKAGKSADEIASGGSGRRRRTEQAEKTNPGDNRRYINHSLRLAALPKISVQDVRAVQDRIVEYFAICADDDMKPSVAGLALAMDIDRGYLWELRAGKKGKNVEVADALKKAMKILDLQMVDYLQNGKINPISGIFMMKSNFGYVDRQEIVVTPSQPLGDQGDPEAIRQKYLESVVDALPEGQKALDAVAEAELTEYADVP